MATCKLTKSINEAKCDYSIAGAQALYLANYFPPSDTTEAAAGQIGYTIDTDGYISAIVLPTGESWYEVKAEQDTLSFTDALLDGSNGGKYRQHTVNALLNRLDVDTLNEGDALSLGKFVGVVMDNAGRLILLGRLSGLKAPAGGFDYNSGAAAADATGWTLIQQGVSAEVAPIVKNLAVLTPVWAPSVEP
jgi:hypothetical protein